MYKIAFSSIARTQLVELSKNSILKRKLERILADLREHPTLGIGKPEKLKYTPKIWSRRLDKKNRICYIIEEEKILVLVVSLLGHYSDK